jgi:very-short-patch-repair endonuclease
MTPSERTLWAALRARGLDGLHFRRQQIIDGFIADFYCSAAGLVLEVDGPVHAAQAFQDAERDRILMARGLRVLRVSNNDVLHHLPATLRRISAACHPFSSEFPDGTVEAKISGILVPTPSLAATPAGTEER